MQVRKNIKRTLLLAVMFTMTSCQSIRECVWTLRDGDKPPPTGSITPPVPPEHGEYTETEAVQKMVNKLIFVISSNSEGGLPFVRPTSDKAAFGLTEKVYVELVSAKVVSASSSGTGDFTLHGTLKNNVFNIVMRSETGKCVFNSSVRLTGAAK